MTTVDAFHTTSQEYSEWHRSVHHDNDECGYGEEIKEEHREVGTAGRPRCHRCTTLATEGK
jgi:hypothetical protein